MTTPMRRRGRQGRERERKPRPSVARRSSKRLVRPLTVRPDRLRRRSRPAPKETHTTKILEAFGLIEEPVVVVPEQAPGSTRASLRWPNLRPTMTRTTHAASAKPKKSKSRTVTTSQGPYQLPSLDLLRVAPPSTNDGTDETRITKALGHTLTTFGVDAKVVNAHRGPTVTMYEVEVAAGTKVNKVLNLSSDIAYALATPDVRIIAPIPGTFGDRHRGAEHPPRFRDAGRHPAIEDRQGRHAPAVGGPGQGHPRPRAAREPVEDAARADRRRHRRRQVQLGQLLHHVDPDAHDARRRAARPDRPQARRDVALRRGAAPAQSRSSCIRSAPPRRCSGSSARWRCATRCSPPWACATSTATKRASPKARFASRSDTRTSTNTCPTSWS